MYLFVVKSANLLFPSSYVAVIIFDWDDTICPSSFVDQYKVESYNDLPLHCQNLFKEISRCAEKCLSMASKFGKVLLITNSDEGWVHYSAERFLPHMLPVLNSGLYKIVSARTRYEQYYPNQPLCWKAAAFAHEVNECYTSLKLAKQELQQYYDDKVSTVSNNSFVSTDGTSNDEGEGVSSDEEDTVIPTGKFDDSGNHQIISFGDSMEERTAVKIVAKQLDARYKSVMFLHCPTPEQIIGQLAMLISHMDNLCNSNDEYMDLEIGQNQAERTAQRYLTVRKRAKAISAEKRRIVNIRK